MRSEDKPALGVSLMLAFCLLAPVTDALAKYLTDVFPALMLVTVRFACQALVLTPLALPMRASLPRTRRFWGLSTLRAALHLAGTWLMIIALSYLPLADALAIAFVLPLLMLLFGKFILAEPVGPRRLWACLFGFGGTLMVIQPSFAEVGAPALIPLAVAFAFAGFSVVTRTLAREVEPILLQAVNGWQALGMIGVCVVLFPILSQGWSWPVGTEWPLLLAVGLTYAAAHLLLTWALRLTPSTTIAPLQYLEIPTATLVGWLVFKDLPNGLAAMGIVVTIAAGLTIVWFERRAEAR